MAGLALAGFQAWMMDHDKYLLKLVLIIVWIWNVLPKIHLLKAWSLAQCSYVELWGSDRNMRSLPSTMVETID
jgi:hypothetical protein